MYSLPIFSKDNFEVFWSLLLRQSLENKVESGQSKEILMATKFYIVSAQINKMEISFTDFSKAVQKNITKKLSIFGIFRIAFFGLIVLSSCNRYIDTSKVKNTPIDQGGLKFYPDSNLFIFKSNVIATRDKEKIYPKSFQVLLPKKIKFYEFVNSSDFGFYYEKGQVIFIKIELEPGVKSQDTTCSPSIEKAVELIQSDFNTGGNKNDIKTVAYYKGRRNALLIKGDATILLYNIVDGNYNSFFNYVNSFKFIN